MFISSIVSSLTEVLSSVSCLLSVILASVGSVHFQGIFFFHLHNSLFVFLLYCFNFHFQFLNYVFFSFPSIVSCASWIYLRVVFISSNCLGFPGFLWALYSFPPNDYVLLDFFQWLCHLFSKDRYHIHRVWIFFLQSCWNIQGLLD